MGAICELRGNSHIVDDLLQPWERVPSAKLDAEQLLF